MKLKRHCQVLFGFKSLALHNTPPQKEPFDFSRGSSGCFLMVPVPPHAWPGVPMLDNHRTGKHSWSGGQTWPCPSWAQTKENRKEREASDTHDIHWAPAARGFICYSKKEGEMMLAMWL